MVAPFLNSNLMSAQTILLLILIGLAAGILSGLVGVGGGIIIVPCLVLFLGFSQKEAQGTSLAILLLPIGIFAVAEYYKQGYINVPNAIIVALAFLIGSYFGSKFSLSISEDKLKKIFAVTLMLLSIRMLFFENHKKDSQANTNAKTVRTNSRDLFQINLCRYSFDYPQIVCSFPRFIVYYSEVVNSINSYFT